MIPFVIFFSILLLALIELLSRREDLRHLHISFELDSRLVEPGEEICLRYTVRNTSRWPLLYAGLTLRLDPVFLVCEDEEWMRRHATVDFTGTRIDHHFYLLGNRKFSGKLRFSVKERGLHDFGRYYLESGDFLGLRPVLRDGPVDLRIICTAQTCEAPHFETLGGELGNVSVHRFILDDPSLVMGYREYSGREPMKQISWNQTAKAGHLMVRQNDFTTDRIAEVIVNMDPTHAPWMERCLSLTRTVCERLEAEKVPYALQSNGDLFSLPEGLGKGHLFFIQRRLGLSRLTGYTGFASLIDRCILQRQMSCTYIIITPSTDDAFEAALSRLRRYTDREPIVLCGGEKI